MVDSARLSLHVPEPAVRPGGQPDFSNVKIPKAGSVPRPEVDVASEDIRDLAYSIIRVLNREGEAVGPWAGSLTDEELLTGLRDMMRLRAFDARMLMAQRQGKTSFYMQHLGEEAVSCAFRKALETGDMNFPTYRQAGLLIADDYPMVEMMNQIYSNERDPLKRPATAGHVFLQGARLLHHLGQSRHPICAGGRLGDGVGDQERHHIAAAWIGDGSTAESDFHSALVFASTYKAPVILNIVNNQWAISTFQGIARGGSGTFAARGLGFGIPALRVDGNDYLAVHAVANWAAERARRNLGPTLIEYVTYRAGAHSTSDDPSAYRPKTEFEAWPLGDPMLRLKNHLIVRGAWSEERHMQAEAEIMDEVIAGAEGRQRRMARCMPAAGLRCATFSRASMPRCRRISAASARRRDTDMPRMTMIEAVRSAMDVSMARDDNVVVFGEDVGYFGGVFRCTQGLQAKYGRTRCFDTPISESGIVGTAIGMAAYGLKPCVEIQFADYMYPAYDQIDAGGGAHPLPFQRRFHLPDRRAHADRRRHFRRPDAQPEPGGAVHPCLRAEGRSCRPIPMTPRAC